jgi:type IV pilus assembly protein PilB
MGAEPFLLASTLNLVIAQRLVRRLCNECKRKIKLDGAAKKLIEQQLTSMHISKEDMAKWMEIDSYEHVGCAQCSNSGYKGRVGIYEVFEITDRAKELIVVNSTALELQKEMISQGHNPMFINGLQLVKDGVTTLPEIMRVAQE